VDHRQACSHLHSASGDVYTGDVVRDYTVRGSSVVQIGQRNTQSVLDWVVAQQRNGGLSSTLEDLVILGDSAGSIGVQLWAARIGAALSWKSTVVVPDAYLAVFPDSIGQVIRDFGACGFFESEALQKDCYEGVITVEDIALDTIKRTGPTVPFLYTSAKSDLLQIGLYAALVLSGGERLTNIVTKEEWYRLANELLESFEDLNAATFWVAGTTHTFTDEFYFYSTTVYGTRIDFDELEVPSLAQWLEDLQLQNRACQQCAGDLENPGESRNNRYCDVNLAKKCAQKF